MKAYKLKENKSTRYHKGRIFVDNQGEAVCLATPVLETELCGNYYFKSLLNDGLLEEVDLKEERWVHPHICKSVKKNLVDWN